MYYVFSYSRGISSSQSRPWWSELCIYVRIYIDGRSAGQIEFLYLFLWDKLKPEILFGIASSRF